MGSTFFRSAIDPGGTLIGKFAGNNSFLAKEAHYDPLSSTLGKYANPGLYSAGVAYGNRRNPTAGYTATPTPYAGKDPTLSDANLGYVNAAGQFGQPQNGNPVRIPAQPPAAWSY